MNETRTRTSVAMLLALVDILLGIVVNWWDVQRCPVNGIEVVNEDNSAHVNHDGRVRPQAGYTEELNTTLRLRVSATQHGIVEIDRGGGAILFGLWERTTRKRDFRARTVLMCSKCR